MLRKVLSITLLLIMGMLPASAQDTNPFMAMLARIPNTPAAQEYFSYIDYHAIFTERPNTPAITSWQQFSDATSTKDQGAAQLMAALLAVHSGRTFMPVFSSRQRISRRQLGSIFSRSIKACSTAILRHQSPC